MASARKRARRRAWRATRRDEWRWWRDGDRLNDKLSRLRMFAAAAGIAGTTTVMAAAALVELAEQGERGPNPERARARVRALREALQAAQESERPW